MTALILILFVLLICCIAMLLIFVNKKFILKFINIRAPCSSFAVKKWVKINIYLNICY